MSRHERYQMDVPASTTGGEAGGDTGRPTPVRDLRLLAFQVGGTFGVAGEIAVLGRLDPALEFVELWSGTSGGVIEAVHEQLYDMAVQCLAGDTSDVVVVVAGELRACAG